MSMLNKIGSWLILAIVLASCTAGQVAFDDGQLLIQSGQVEEGLAKLEAAMKENPKQVEFKTAYVRQKELYIQSLLNKADSARALRDFEQADTLYRRVLKQEDNHPRALAGIASVAQDRAHTELIAKADKLFAEAKDDEAREIVRTILAENPRQERATKLLRALDEKAAAKKQKDSALNAAFKKPITLEFRDANLKAIFEVIARTTQINFIFDRDVRPDLKSTIFVKNTTIEDVINLLLVTNQLEKRILNENTVLIYPNTPVKVKDYQELVVRAFYLANADVKQTLNMIKTLVKTRDVFIDEKLGLLVMKDTPEAIRLAEKLINTQDRAEPEVMLEVEVLEVKRSRLLDLGIQYPNNFTALNIALTDTVTTSNGSTVATTTTQTQNIVTVQTLKGLSGKNIAISPNLALNLRKDDGDVQILANPRIRVKNKEKAKIHIGEKVPVITTTSTANVGVSEAVNFLDVGLKLDVEPQVFLDQEVGIKVGLEVSSIVREVRSATGTLTYQVGTRNAATVLRLADGETQVLAGLINDEDRKSASKIPLLGDLPVIGRLFSTHRDETTKTEIVLLITPHIVRNVTRLDAAQSEFVSGTESAIGAGSLSLRASAQQPSAPAPVRTPGATPAPVPQPTSTAPVSVFMSATPTIGKGQELNVVIQANATTEIKAANFEFTYDPDYFEAVRVSEGALLKQGNGSTAFQGDATNASGRMPIQITRAVGGVKGTGALAIVVLRALEGVSGQTQLGLEAINVLNPAGSGIQVPAPQPFSVTIQP